jgi:hypothetical protein
MRLKSHRTDLLERLRDADYAAEYLAQVLAGIAYLLIVLFAMSPVLCAMLASLIASLCGSRLDEGNAYPCFVLGVDIGGLLSHMFVLGWLSLITVPIGLICIVAVTREFRKEVQCEPDGKTRNAN